MPVNQICIRMRTPAHIAGAAQCGSTVDFKKTSWNTALFVIPAKAGIYFAFVLKYLKWIPAFAGMTDHEA
jgi:hypothetical protein